MQRKMITSSSSSSSSGFCSSFLDASKQKMKPKNRMQVAILMFILLISIGLGSFTLGDDARSESDKALQMRHLKVVSLARHLDSDFYKRFNGSVARLELDYKILMGDQSEIVEKVRLALSNYKDDDNLIILLALDDRLVLNGKEGEFLEKFGSFAGTQIVLASNLEQHGSPTSASPNCKAMLGEARALWKLFESNNNDGDAAEETVESHCARAYADEARRKSLGLAIDERFDIFQPLIDFAGQEHKLKLVETMDKCELHNLATLSTPLVVLPSSQVSESDSTQLLNSLGNYLGLAWTRRNGTRTIADAATQDEAQRELASPEPGVLIGLFILEPTPFLEHFFELVLGLDWPRRENVHLIMYNSVQGHAAQVDTFRARVSGLPFASFKILSRSQKLISSRGEVRPAYDDSDPDPDDDNDRRSSGANDKTTSDHEPAGTREQQQQQRQAQALEREHSAELEARAAALEHCKQLGPSKCDYYLHLESLARIGAPGALRDLVSVNRTLVAPLLSRPSRLWANFWGAQTADNYYARSFDYVDLVRGEKRGLWAVNLVRHAFLLEASFVRAELARYSYSPAPSAHLETSAGLNLADHVKSAVKSNANDLDQQNKNAENEKSTLDHRHQYLSSLDYLSQQQPLAKNSAFDARELRDRLRVNYAISMARQLQALGKLQFVLNTRHLGHLVDPSSYDLNKTRPDLYQMEENILDWEREFLHENYSRIFDEDEQHQELLRRSEKTKEGVLHLISQRNQHQEASANESTSAQEQVTPNAFIEEPCRDVFWFPLVSERFTQDLIAVMEAFGKWSAGTNYDPRIEGAYESVPTRDIHFRQVGLHEMWLSFLRYYVMPVQLRQFIGYEHDPPRADLAFVVRYHPNEQASLRPHHDSSTYTLNVALNSPSLGHYEGGGCRFVRQNCSVTQSRAGWALIHPGRLTHYHEGLPVRAGTRYILVTFIDP